MQRPPANRASAFVLLNEMFCSSTPGVSRRTLLKAALFSTASVLHVRPPLLAAEAAFAFDPAADIIQTPDDPALWPRFREQLGAWRLQQLPELRHSDALYRRADFAWVQSNFACCFLMLCDERFYDASAGKYRVKEWMDAGQRDFGGFDSVVLWHAYPRIGLDDRNQFDFYRDAPGGLDGLRGAVDELHGGGLRVFIDYNPWDTGTRREPQGDIDVLCELVAALDVDGIFLDTMQEGAAEFRQKLDAVRRGVVLEGEIALPMTRLADHHMAWAQGFVDSEAPGVVRNKWLERRHQLHHVSRWSRDRTSQFQTSFMNGTGSLVWDNVFGTWVGYSEREKSILRAMLPIQRRFTAIFAGEQWTPLLPTSAADVYASLWEGDGIRLWTIVNRAEHEVTMEVPGVELKEGEQLWDLIRGDEVQSAGTTIRPRGIGCLVAARKEALGNDFNVFLQRQRATDHAANWDPAFPADIKTRLKRVLPTQAYARESLPSDMAIISGGKHHFTLIYRIRECGWYESTPEQIKGWGRLHQLTSHERDVVLAPYAIDLTPVTNAQYAAFLAGSGYRPRDATNFLKHWRDGAPPAGQEEHPVVYVDLADARAFAQWSGKRLPTEEEWQFAAQGTDGRKFPWGNQPPQPQDKLCNGYGTGTTPVRQFPDGRSPFGLYDLCGNTWEWTESERSDGVTRFAILRGGATIRRRARTGTWTEGRRKFRLVPNACSPGPASTAAPPSASAAWRICSQLDLCESFTDC